MNHHENMGPLISALAAAQSELRNVARNKAGQVRGKRDYRYAGLDDLLDAVRPVLARHGVAFTQIVLATEHGMILQTTLLHGEGGSISSDYPIPRLEDPQAQGSALTYARRYSLEAIVGVAPTYDPVDDDGAEVSTAVASRTPPPQTEQRAPTEREATIARLKASAARVGDGYSALAAAVGLSKESPTDDLRALAERCDRIVEARSRPWQDPATPYGAALEEALASLEEDTTAADAVEAALASAVPIRDGEPDVDIDNGQIARRYMTYLRDLARV